MTTVNAIIEHIESIAGHALNSDEGIHHGDGGREVNGATVAWMATPDAIRAAGEAGHEFLIAHESVYFPYDVVNSTNPPPDWQAWQVNRQRRQLLEQYDLTLARVHGTADEISIFDAFAEMLDLGDAVSANGLAKVYEIPACPLDVLVERVKEKMGMAHVRVAVAGDLSRTVSRVGLPWGGLGLFVNVGYMQRLIVQGCDVFIAGESDNYGFRFAVECGISMIETSHELSENAGLQRFTVMLDEAFPDVDFSFYENDCVWLVK